MNFVWPYLTRMAFTRQSPLTEIFPGPQAAACAPFHLLLTGPTGIRMYPARSGGAGPIPGGALSSVGRATDF
jgi:hypothetical protein